MKKIRLTETELTNIIKKVVKETLNDKQRDLRADLTKFLQEYHARMTDSEIHEVLKFITNTYEPRKIKK